MRNVVLLSRQELIREQVAEMAAAVDVSLIVAETFEDACAHPGSLTLIDAGALDEHGSALLDAHTARDLVLLSNGTDPGVWEAAVRIGADRVVLLPDGWSWLRGKLASLADPGGPSGRTVCVVGARGGCGATTISAAIARAAADRGTTTLLVDGDPAGSGLDLALGLEETEGLRWPDLSAARGQLPAAALSERLPTSERIAILSQRSGAASASSSWLPALSALRRSYDVTIVDLPRYRLDWAAVPAESAVILVTTLELTAVATARALLDGPLEAFPCVTAVRVGSGPLSLSAVGKALAPADLVSIPRSRAVMGAADFGDLLTSVTSGGIGKAAEHLLATAWPLSAAA
ncbi:MAG: septum site-determining protein Ssd [Candidatus Nanopelagicales bacterium]|nr:septum site-determining protein Ssd [Candidatus Nanopelagicales bacterium]